MPKPCPTCGGRITFRSAPHAPRPRDGWQTFWSGWTVCPGCGAPVRMRLGLVGHLGQVLAQLAAAVPVYLLTRPLPDPWPVLAFLLLFTPLLLAVTALGQWVRWTFGTPVPLPPPPPPAGPSR